ncbi:hypothetical protein BGZ76_007846 [Entomortierella beljakovae]|nr:hypothetical protein BGZ76_007846 [Entomortierella beljakovae]
MEHLEVSDTYSNDNGDHIFPYCGNRYSITSMSDNDNSTPSRNSNSCTSARCKEGNPHCLNYVGQDRWEKEDAFDRYFANVTDKPNPELMRRHDNTPAGMKNLGATCYANALLQVWFHDFVFRDAIYRCRFKNGNSGSMNALYQLQLLFTYLDNGLRSYYNPLSLVESLKLDTAMQQDAQEFCNLFMAKIDNELHNQEDPYLGDFIKNQFQGKYSYQTTCKNCKNTSTRDCKFYELMLNIKDGCSLMDSFDEFVQAEELTGADQTSESVIYDLSAVLVHSGPGAHSGHFMAFVLDRSSDKWFILNDEEVSEFNGTKFDPEDLSEESPKTKQNKAVDSENAQSDKLLNTLSSRNAYMLTYTKRIPQYQRKPSSPPSEILDIVSLDNYSFDKDIQEYREYLREMRRELYQNWDVNGDEDNGFYISSDALTTYIQSESNELKILDNSSIACEHQKLSPAAVTSSKRISKTAMRLLEERDQVKVEPILTVDDLCEICTRDICQDKLYTLSHRRDIDEFERKAKGIRSPTAAWISKNWLADWLRVSPRFHPFHKTTADDPSPDSEAYKSDVICPHSYLAVDKTVRKQINQAALGVLTKVFGQINLPDADAIECLVCKGHLQPHIENIKDMTAKGTSEKQELGGILMRGPRFNEMETGINYFAVSKQGFMKTWHDFVKRPSVNMPPHFIDNTSLICKHEGFIFDLNNIVDNGKDDDLYVLSEDEWSFLQAIYGGGPTVVIKTAKAKNESSCCDSDESIVETTPSLCIACRNERILDFSSTVFVIRVYTSKKTADGDVPSNSTELNSVDSSPNKSLGTKRKQGATTTRSEAGTRRSKRVKPSERLYKEIKIPTSKWDTVMDLKLKIMQKTDIVPLYQRLVYERIELDNNESTIADLEIPPSAVIDLFAFDQDMEDLDMSTFQDVVSIPGDEGGFGGTGLSDWQFIVQ